MLKKIVFVTALMAGTSLISISKVTAADTGDGFKAIKTIQATFTQERYRNTHNLRYALMATKAMKLLAIGVGLDINESKNERGKKIKVLRNYGITAARNWFNAEKDTYMDIIQKAAKATHRGGVKFDEIAKEAKDPLTQKQCKVVQTLYNTERTKLGLATVLGGCLDFATESDIKAVKPRVSVAPFAVPMAGEELGSPFLPPPPPPSPEPED